MEGVAWDISHMCTGEIGVGAGLLEVVADGVIINYFTMVVSKNWYFGDIILNDIIDFWFGFTISSINFEFI